MPDHTLHAQTGHFEITGRRVRLTVTKPSQLSEALRTNKPIVINNAELERRFRSLQRWQEARAWVFGFIVASLLAYAISRDYKIEAGWQKNWEINTSEGRVILMPMERKQN